MENPFKPDEKVFTKIKGVEVEVTVRLTFNNEVQVKCPDGSLRWRTAKTVWRPTVPADAPSPAADPAPEPVPVVEATAPAESIPPAEEPAPSVEATTASNESSAAASEIARQPVDVRMLIVCSGDTGTKPPKTKRNKRK